MAEAQATRGTGYDFALDLTKYLTETVAGRRHNCNVYKIPMEEFPPALTGLLDEGWTVQYTAFGQEQSVIGGAPQTVAIVYATREVAVRLADG